MNFVGVVVFYDARRSKEFWVGKAWQICPNASVHANFHWNG